MHRNKQTSRYSSSAGRTPGRGKLASAALIVCMLAAGCVGSNPQARAGAQTAPKRAIPTASFSDGAPFPGPGPHVIAAAGGTLQAENFNKGPRQQAFWACTPGDQGSGTSYRADAHDIDIRPSGGGWFIQSSPGPGCPLSWTPKVSGVEYVKYSFVVAQTGWYQMTGVTAGPGGGMLASRIDDTNVGSAYIPGAWTSVVLAPFVHLTAGPTHVLTIEIYGNGVGIDSISFAPTTASFPAPRVVSAPLTADEVVVADAVVTDPAFGAVANNPGVDNTAAIQNALTTVGEEGGGTVYVPPGTYTVQHSLVVPEGVTLHGDWSSNTSASGQTILAADVPSGATGTPFITLGGNTAGVSHLGVWYPHQNPTAPVRYPPTIYSPAAYVTVSHVTLYNSDQGVDFVIGTNDVDSLLATCFTYCISYANNYEYAFLTNVIDANRIWETAPAVVTGRPTTHAERVALEHWTKAHLTVIRSYHSDNVSIYKVNGADARYAIAAIGSRAPNGTYGSFSKITGAVDRSGDNHIARPLRDVSSIMETDLVPATKNIAYQFAPARKPSTTNFYNVKASPYFAVADGVTDDTGAIQAALNAAGAAGGGTVYLPAGTYLVSTHLLVPSGVELRGSYDGRPILTGGVDGTVLVAVEGQGTPWPDTATAFISLSAHSGVRGIVVRYPNQGFGSAAYPVVPFPYTIRSLGAGTWFEHSDVFNGYQLADFTTYRSDGFVIKDVWGMAFRTGYNMGGGSQTGWLERSVISYAGFGGPVLRNAPQDYGMQTLLNYFHAHAVAYYLGNVAHFQSFGMQSFRAGTELVTYRPTATASGPTNAVLFAPSDDSALHAGFQLDAGTNLTFVGLLARTAGPSNSYVVTGRRFAGTANIYDNLIVGESLGIQQHGRGTLKLYYESTPRQRARSL